MNANILLRFLHNVAGRTRFVWRISRNGIGKIASFAAEYLPLTEKTL